MSPRRRRARRTRRPSGKQRHRRRRGVYRHGRRRDSARRRRSAAGAIVGAGAVVIADVPMANAIVYGNPVARARTGRPMSSATCRSCGHAHPPSRSWISVLAARPTASPNKNELGAGETLYPLHAYVCEACLLVQLELFETPEQIFRDYSYFSSYSTSWLDHAERYVATMLAERGIRARATVSLNSPAMTAICFSTSYAPESRSSVSIRHQTSPRWRAIAACRQSTSFSALRWPNASRAEVGPADLMVANNVLAHVPHQRLQPAGSRRCWRRTAS